MIKINEIFYSIQGESTWAGLPTVFVRTTGCNLRCTYCDTKYSYVDGNNMSISQLLDVIEGYPTPYVCITGGEPLLQKETLPLMSALLDTKHFVSLETSGSKTCKDVDPRVKIILDVKTPDSGAKDTFLFENFNYINQHTEFKFVICSYDDFQWTVEFCKANNLFHHYTLLISPSYSQISEQWLAEQILSSRLPFRLQLQQHKYIWTPETRGV